MLRNEFAQLYVLNNPTAVELLSKGFQSKVESEVEGNKPADNKLMRECAALASARRSRKANRPLYGIND